MANKPNSQKRKLGKFFALALLAFALAATQAHAQTTGGPTVIDVTFDPDDVPTINLLPAVTALVGRYWLVMLPVLGTLIVGVMGPKGALDFFMGRAQRLIRR